MIGNNKIRIKKRKKKKTTNLDFLLEPLIMSNSCHVSALRWARGCPDERRPETREDKGGERTEEDKKRERRLEERFPR